MRTPARRSARLHDRVVDAWMSSVRGACPEIAAGPPFVPVVVAPAADATTRRAVDGALDWWERAAIAERQRSFRGRLLWSRAAFPYPVDGGSAHTARLLWDARHDAALEPAIWLAAFLLQTQCASGAPPVWEASQPRALLEDVLDLCLEILFDADVPLWHHKSSDALRGADGPARRLRHLGVTPRTPHDVVATALVALRLTLADRTFVRLVVADPTTGLRPLPDRAAAHR